MVERLLRLSVGLVLFVGVAGLVPTSRAAAWGVTGDYSMIDSRSLNAAGVICFNNLATDPITVSIEARDVVLKRTSGYTKQTTSVQYLLYQELAGGTLNLVDRSPLMMAMTEASGAAAFGPYTFENRGIGPRYVVVVDMIWYDDATEPIGGSQVRFKNYEVRKHFPDNTGDSSISIQSACNPTVPPLVVASASEGTVQSPLSFSIRYFPSKVTVFIRWDGIQSIGSITTTAAGDGSGVVRIPAAPMGTHTLKWQYDSWADSATYTIKPRIKVIESTVKRGQTVNVSLRGFAAKEVVRIRWKKGSSWIELGKITTSSTGSANAYLKVPTWAPNGSASIRGDGSYGRAQTNAVTVSGGPYTGSTLKPSPTATPTAAATATLSPIATVESPDETPIETATPEPVVTETPGLPTESATPTLEPTVEATQTSEPSTEESTTTPADDTDATAELSPTETLAPTGTEASTVTGTAESTS